VSARVQVAYIREPIIRVATSEEVRHFSSKLCEGERNMQERERDVRKRKRHKRSLSVTLSVTVYVSEVKRKLTAFPLSYLY